MKKIIVSGLILTMPFFAMAEGLKPLEKIVLTVRNLASSLIPIFMMFAVAVFLWGIVKYITSAGDEEKRKSAQGYIIYGLIGIFVMIAFWGIIKVFADTFGIQTGGTITPPGFNP